MLRSAFKLIIRLASSASTLLIAERSSKELAPWGMRTFLVSWIWRRAALVKV
jgi:hypothetical protein